MKRWWKSAVRLVKDNWQSLLDWYLERERQKAIEKRQEMGDL